MAKLHSWVPSAIRFAVRESSVDSDGFWIYLHDEFEVDNGSTVSGDTAAEAVEYFHGGDWNAALQTAWDKRAPERAKAKAKAKVAGEARLAKAVVAGSAPIAPASRPVGVSDQAWNGYLARLAQWNAAQVKANRTGYGSPY